MASDMALSMLEWWVRVPPGSFLQNKLDEEVKQFTIKLLEL